MSIFDSNYLEANNVAVWLSGEESSNRFLSDFIVVRNNIIVHNDWTAFGEPKLYGKDILLFTSNTRDVYFDNNTIAYNRGGSVVGVQNRPPQNEFGNIWFRNNIFWENTGGVNFQAGVDPGAFHFLNNLWDKAFAGDPHALTGDPRFAAPNSRAPEGYSTPIPAHRRVSGSRAVRRHRPGPPPLREPRGFLERPAAPPVQDPEIRPRRPRIRYGRPRAHRARPLGRFRSRFRRSSCSLRPNRSARESRREKGVKGDTVHNALN